MGKGKAKPRKRSVPRDLTATGAESVKGGDRAVLNTRKAGGNQQDYMVVKLEEVQITSV